MNIMVGGTFSPLHDGHKKLIARSFELAGDAGHVVIGLSTDAFAGSKIHPIMPFSERRRALESFISASKFSASWEIEPLEDKYWSTLNSDFDALVVSEETYPVGLEINRLRKEKGRKKVDIYQITCVLAEDGRWISSTRIHRGEIDDHGRVIR